MFVKGFLFIQSFTTTTLCYELKLHIKWRTHLLQQQSKIDHICHWSSNWIHRRMKSIKNVTWKKPDIPGKTKFSVHDTIPSIWVICFANSILTRHGLCNALLVFCVVTVDFILRNKKIYQIFCFVIFLIFIGRNVKELLNNFFFIDFLSDGDVWS